MWSYPCTLATHRVFIAFHSPSTTKTHPQPPSLLADTTHTHSKAHGYAWLFVSVWIKKSDNESIIESVRFNMRVCVRACARIGVFWAFMHVMMLIKTAFVVISITPQQANWWLSISLSSLSFLKKTAFSWKCLSYIHFFQNQLISLFPNLSFFFFFACLAILQGLRCWLPPVDASTCCIFKYGFKLFQVGQWFNYSQWHMKKRPINPHHLSRVKCVPCF